MGLAEVRVAPMKTTNENPWEKSHHNVTLVVSAQGLPSGKFEIVGYFYPNGFLGERVRQYAYRVESRASYDHVSKSLKARYGNTPVAANALFEAMRPTGLIRTP